LRVLVRILLIGQGNSRSLSLALNYFFKLPPYSSLDIQHFNTVLKTMSVESTENKEKLLFSFEN
jgi:hypothetical protein